MNNKNYSTKNRPSQETSDGIWLRTDEFEEFIGALEHSAELGTSASDNGMQWKWLILALHNALQGACACALRGQDTTGVSLLTKKSAEAVWYWLDVESRKDPNGPMPEERLASMMVLYERVQHADYLRAPHRLPKHDERNSDVAKLNKLRNQFSHFVPHGLSLEVSGMPRIVSHCCDAIEHLAVTHSTFWHHLDEPRSSRISAALLTLRDAMEAWDKQHKADRG